MKTMSPSEKPEQQEHADTKRLDWLMTKAGTWDRTAIDAAMGTLPQAQPALRSEEKPTLAEFVEWLAEKPGESWRIHDADIQLFLSESGIPPRSEEKLEAEQVRRGWRGFLCDCGKSWKQATRDHTSPSVETCPSCGLDEQPIASWPDAKLHADRMGNLINDEPIEDWKPESASGIKEAGDATTRET